MKTQQPNHNPLSSYILGFVLSVALTLAAYFLVTERIFETGTLSVLVVCLALVQLVVQLVFFLHLDKEVRPRFNLTTLLFTLLVVTILVGGTLWVMYHLNYNMDASEVRRLMEEGL